MTYLGLSHSSALLLYTLAAVIGLIVLIARFKVNSIVALVLASLFIGLCARMEPAQLLKGFREGVGNVLGSIPMILAFGNMLGKMLEESGGAERIATTLVAWFGPRRVHWAMMVIACVVGVPVFFQVGFVLLIPLALTSTRGWIRRLGGKRWQALHRLIYVSAIAGVIHYWWLVKADVTKPRQYAFVLSLLLGYRIVAWLVRKNRERKASSALAEQAEVLVVFHWNQRQRQVN